MYWGVLDSLQDRSHTGEESLRLKDVLLGQLERNFVKRQSLTSSISNLVTLNEPCEVGRGKFSVPNEYYSK